MAGSISPEERASTCHEKDSGDYRALRLPMGLCGRRLVATKSWILGSSDSLREMMVAAR
jgi:hypothetical protein